MSSERLDYIKEFLDALYTDNKFLYDLLDCCADPQKNDGVKCLAEKKFTFQSGDIDLVDQLRAPSGDLEILRLAGGAYRFHTNEAGFWELMVDSKERAIYIDFKPVENQHVDKEGNVCFTYSGYEFQLQFTFPWLLGEDQPDRLGFSGKIAKGTATTAVQAHRCFPWGNAYDSNLPTNPDIPSSQTATDEMMDAVDDFRDDLASKSYAVGIDLIEARKPAGKEEPVEYALVGGRPRRPKGDELLQGTSVTLTALGFALRSADLLGKGWDSLFGTVIGAAGAAISNTVKSRFVDDDKRRMTNKVLCYELSGLQPLLDVQAKEMVNGVPETQLRNKEYIDQLYKQFRDNYYIPWARSMMSDFIYKKYGIMHKFWRSDFIATYEKALETRFDKQMPKASLNALFTSYMEQRWAENVAPKKLDWLARDLQHHDEVYRTKVADIDKRDDLSAEEKEDQKKVATNEFEKDKEDIEKKNRTIKKDTRDIKDRMNDNEADHLIENIRRDTEEARRTEEWRIRQEKGRH